MRCRHRATVLVADLSVLDRSEIPQRKTKPRNGNAIAYEARVLPSNPRPLKFTKEIFVTLVGAKLTRKDFVFGAPFSVVFVGFFHVPTAET